MNKKGGTINLVQTKCDDTRLNYKLLRQIGTHPSILIINLQSVVFFISGPLGSQSYPALDPSCGQQPWSISHCSWVYHFSLWCYTVAVKSSSSMQKNSSFLHFTTLLRDIEIQVCIPFCIFIGPPLRMSHEGMTKIYTYRCFGISQFCC